MTFLFSVSKNIHFTYVLLLLFIYKKNLPFINHMKYYNNMKNYILNNYSLFASFITSIFIGGSIILFLDILIEEHFATINIYYKSICFNYVRCISFLLFFVYAINAVSILNIVQEFILRLCSLLPSFFLFMFVRKGIKVSTSQSKNTTKFLNLDIERVMSEEEVESIIYKIKKNLLNPKLDLTPSDIDDIKMESYTINNNISKEKLISNTEEYFNSLNEYYDYLEDQKVWFSFFGYSITNDTFAYIGGMIFTLSLNFLASRLLSIGISKVRSEFFNGNTTESRLDKLEADFNRIDSDNSRISREFNSGERVLRNMIYENEKRMDANYAEIVDKLRSAGFNITCIGNNIRDLENQSSMLDYENDILRLIEEIKKKGG